MATLTQQLNLTNSAMARMVRAATDGELLALTGSEVCDLSGLSDAELDQVIGGTAPSEAMAKVWRQGSTV